MMMIITARTSFLSAAAAVAPSLLLLLLTTTATNALAPPHPTLFADYETVYDYRKRLNITYNYSPKYLTDEHCKHWTEDECRYYDQARERDIQQRRRQRLRNKGRKLYEQPYRNPPVGQFKVLILLVQFPEHDADDDASTALPTREYFDELYNGIGASEINPVGSIREWLLYNSAHRYNPTFDVMDWTLTNESEAYFAAGVSGKRNPQFMKHVFIPVLDKMDAEGFDFRPYDGNNDMHLDHLMIITSGYPAEIGSSPCAPPSSDRIWSQGCGHMTNGWTSSQGIMLNGFTISSAWTYPLCGVPTTMAIGLHEYLHGFNLIDLYDCDRDEGSYGIAGAGSFDMMANAYGWSNNGNKPGHVGPYGRLQLGWVDAIDVTESGFYTLQAAEVSGQVLRIGEPYFPPDEYLLIENRWGIKWSDDWACSGIVIWHIDDAVKDRQCNRGYPGHRNWPRDHYRVAVQQADGNYDIEHMRNLGDSGDCWTNGTVMGSSLSTWPNTASYQNGTTYETGIEIKILTAPSFVMQLQITGA